MFGKLAGEFRSGFEQGGTTRGAKKQFPQRVLRKPISSVGKKRVVVVTDGPNDRENSARSRKEKRAATVGKKKKS